LKSDLAWLNADVCYYRVKPSSQLPVLNSTGDVIKFMRQNARSRAFGHREYMLVVPVDFHFRPLAIITSGVGTFDTTGDVYFSQLVADPLALRASGYYVFHNHPTLTPEPSTADIRFTQALAKYSDLVSMPLIDHIVLAGDTAFSFNEFFKNKDYKGYNYEIYVKEEAEKGGEVTAPIKAKGTRRSR
jgi:DNA repair protein RadC